ncbi:hypothetical protein [Corynebacterium crudilactis]|nr:hypothetical protein [Corynebacterium crudilactis]
MAQPAITIMAMSGMAAIARPFTTVCMMLMAVPLIMVFHVFS